MPNWTDKLARPIRDTIDKVTISTRDDARSYLTTLPDQHARKSQWQAAAKLLLEGADAEAVTKAIELALFFEGRIDLREQAAFVRNNWRVILVGMRFQVAFQRGRTLPSRSS